MHHLTIVRCSEFLFKNLGKEFHSTKDLHLHAYRSITFTSTCTLFYWLDSYLQSKTGTLQCFICFGKHSANIFCMVGDFDVVDIWIEFIQGWLIYYFLIDWLGPLSWSISCCCSPLVVNLCRRKNVRILSLVGGLLFPLALLFTSFATELHQIFFT